MKIWKDKKGFYIQVGEKWKTPIADKVLHDPELFLQAIRDNLNAHAGKVII